MSSTESTEQVSVSGIEIFDAASAASVPAQTSGWLPVGGGLSQISVGSADVIWGVNKDHAIFRFVNGRWKSEPNGALMNISAAADGTVMGVNRDGNLFRFDGTAFPAFAPAPGVKLAQVSVGSASDVWAVSTTGAVLQLNAQRNGWDSVAGVAGTTKRVSVAKDGTVFALNKAGKVFRYTANPSDPWMTLPGTFTQISVGSASRVWGVGADGNVYWWNGIVWSLVAGGTMLAVAVDEDGTVWGLTRATEGANVAYYVPPASLVLYNPRLEQSLKQGEMATYFFDMANTTPGTQLTNVKVTLQGNFPSGSGIAVHDVLLPTPLLYGQSQTGAALLSTTSSTPLGNYALTHATVTYGVKPLITTGVVTRWGGSLPFTVVKP